MYPESYNDNFVTRILTKFHSKEVITMAVQNSANLTMTLDMLENWCERTSRVPTSAPRVLEIFYLPRQSEARDVEQIIRFVGRIRPVHVLYFAVEGRHSKNDFVKEVEALRQYEVVFIEKAARKVPSYQKNGTVPVVFHLSVLKKRFSVSKETALTWSSRTRKIKKASVLLPSVCDDLVGANVTVAAVKFPPYFVLKKAPDGSSVLSWGPESNSMQSVMQQYRLNYKLVVAKDTKGADKWQGHLEMLWNQEADIGGGLFIIAQKSFQYVGFAVPYVVTPTHYYTRAPTLKSKVTSLVRPFSPQVWVSVVASLVVITTSYFAIIGTEGKLFEKSTPGFFRIFWYFSSTLLQNGSKLKMSSNARYRLIIGGWQIFVFAIVYSYSCILLSFMVIPEYTRPLNTVSELIRQVEKGNMLVGTKYQSTVHYYIMQTKSGPLKVVKEAISKDRDNLVPDYKSGMQRSIDKKYAFLMGKLPATFGVIQVGMEKIHCSKEYFYTISTAAAIPKTHPCREKFKMGMMRVTEAGLVDRWVDVMMTKVRIPAAVRTVYESEDVKPLDLKGLQGAFYFLFTGYSISLLALVSEVITQRCKKCIRHPHL